MIYEPIYVVLRERTPKERLQPGAGSYAVLECGFRTANIVKAKSEGKRERGRMVGVLLERPEQLPDALEELAYLWDGYCKRHPKETGRGVGPVKFRVPPGAVGDRTMRADALPMLFLRMARVMQGRRAA